MGKPLERRVAKFTGVNTFADPHKIGTSAATRINNAYVDMGSVIKSRPGRTLLTAGNFLAASGAFILARDQHLYVFHAGSMKDLGFFPGSTLAHYSDGFGSYVSSEVALGIYGKDGSFTLVDESLVSPRPSVTTTSGKLLGGRYGVVVIQKGDKVGFLPSIPVRVESPGGISISSGVDADVYITSPDGSGYYYLNSCYAGEILQVSDPSYSMRLGTPIPITYRAPMQPGSVVTMAMGCLVTAMGNLICISDPLEPNYFDPLSGYIELPDPVTNLISIGNTTYIGTEKEIYIAYGTDPKKWVLTLISKFGAVRNSGRLTTLQLPNDNTFQTVAVFTQLDGAVMVGTSQGILYNLTYDLLGAPPNEKINGAYFLGGYIYITY